MLYILVITVAILGLFAVLTLRSNEKKRYSWLQFYAQGKDAGFSFKEIELLRRVAVNVDLEDPSTLFTSETQLDRCIRAILQKNQITGEDRDKETQDFLARLYEYRKKIEFDNPRLKKGITSTRQIAEDQKIRLLIDGAGVYDSRLLRNSDRFLTVSNPEGKRLPAQFSWKGRRLSVYFWRRNDAGYVFDTYVLDEVRAGGTPLLQLAHSDSLFRTQKRRSIRAKTRKSAYLYLPQGEESPEKVEVKPGLRCIIEDLSDGGCAVTIGGKAVVGLPVKLQFEIDGEPVVMTGVVKSSEYDEGKNRSLLHIQANPLSLVTRNRILAEVFGVQVESNYEIPREDEENAKKEDSN